MANNIIKMNEGLEKFNLVFTDRNDSAVEIAFNPYDTDILIRMKKAEGNINEAMKTLEKSAEEEPDTETLSRVNEIVGREIDYIFGNKISARVFQNCGPLSMNAAGETFVERFMRAVAPYIRSRVDEAGRAGAERMEKHVGKYAAKAKQAKK